MDTATKALNTETERVNSEKMQVVGIDKVYSMHAHYERERKFSLLLLGLGGFLILCSFCSLFLISGNAYRTGIASVLLLAGIVIGGKGFLINLKNQRRYNELASKLLVTRQFTPWFNRQEHQYTKKILLLLATEEIFLSLVFVTVLLFLNLVKGAGFWTGIFDGLLPVVGTLLIGNTYRAFMYSRYSSKMENRE